MTEAAIDLVEYGDAFRVDPHPVYAELRGLGTVHRVRPPSPWRWRDGPSPRATRW
ncbi:hypothetical protein ABTZ93_03330 [Streptomyces sp. NPDC097941]|uniref:hypothetical protein n=1 Tax=Streptomyces sp. NPDC097941 TaxID=3155685 RepID=UPI00331E07AF